MRLFAALLIFAVACHSIVITTKGQTPAQPDKPRTPSATSPTSKEQEVGENEIIRVTTSLVKVPVAVRDRQGRYIDNLAKGDFKIYEDGVEQRPSHFGGVEEPISVVLLIDISCSIKKPEDTIKAALAFIDQLRPADSVLPIAFGQKIYALLTESTRDKALLRERILLLPDGKQIPCDNGTRLGDAVEFVINHVINTPPSRGAVILLTDGRDSEVSRPGWMYRSLRAVSEGGVPFYSVRLVPRTEWEIFAGFPDDPPAEKAKLRFENKDRQAYIDDLASISGGRSFPARRGDELKSFFEQIGEELRHQYMLAYYSDSSKEKPKRERRKIKVRVNRKNVSVRARDAYIYVPPVK